MSNINPVIYYHQGMNGVYWPASINPYRRGSRPHEVWLSGWRAARRQKLAKRRRRRNAAKRPSR